ncbi:MAG TPA: hypothetical protein VG406_01155 [Isosphaeraceae bacterium]|jgi:hypothetical protein|nr:hypothetical protein [Isosphaeraceae bacterium]
MATAPRRRRAKAEDVTSRLSALLAEQLIEEKKVRGLWTITNATPSLEKWGQIIIWDGWYGVPFRDRPAIAFEAFARFIPRIRDETHVISCLTPDEAISMGYFPYRVAPITRGIDDDTRERIEEALLDEGAIETAEGTQMRFMFIEQAQEAFVRLQEKVSGPYWTIVEEVSRSG